MHRNLPLLFCASLLAFAATLQAQPDSGYSFADTSGDHLDVQFNGKTLVRYQYAFDKSTPERLHETYKPFLHVMDAAGVAPITKGPGGEFTHHRGWFLGWSKITTPDGQTVDRWHMKGGNIIHQKFVSQKANKDAAIFSVELLWEGSGSAPILSEERTYTIHALPPPVYLQVEMSTKIKALTGETKLDGDPEHAGFQFRPAGEVDRTQTTYLFPKTDADPKKDRDYAWVAENFVLGEKRYSVAFLNHPINPRDTPFSAYRDYGRFGAFFRTTIPADGTLNLKGSILVAEGSPLSAELIQKVANVFTAQNDPVPSVTERHADAPAAKPVKKDTPTAKPAPEPAK